MASYINLTLDTTGVTPLQMLINDGAARCASTSVKVTITLAEEDMEYADSYSMAFFGDVAGSGEWMKFAYSAGLRLAFPWYFSINFCNRCRSLSGMDA